MLTLSRLANICCHAGVGRGVIGTRDVAIVVEEEEALLVELVISSNK